MGVLLIAQIVLMARFLKEPRARGPWYNATGTQPLCDGNARLGVRSQKRSGLTPAGRPGRVSM